MVKQPSRYCASCVLCNGTCTVVITAACVGALLTCGEKSGK